MQQGLEAEDLSGVLDPLLALPLRHLADLEAEPEILLDIHVRVERVVLEHHRDVALFRFEVGHLRVADLDLARRDILQARQQAQDRRFAASRRADEHHELAVADLERHVVHGDDLVGEQLRDSFEDDLGHQGLLPRRAVWFESRSWVKVERTESRAALVARM